MADFYCLFHKVHLSTALSIFSAGTTDSECVIDGGEAAVGRQKSPRCQRPQWRRERPGLLLCFWRPCRGWGRKCWLALPWCHPPSDQATITGRMRFLSSHSHTLSFFFSLSFFLFFPLSVSLWCSLRLTFSQPTSLDWNWSLKNVKSWVGE